MTIRKKFTLTFPANKNIPQHWGNHRRPVATRFFDYAQKSCDNKGVNYGQWQSCRYVITVMLHEDTLTEINELNNYLTRDGFLLTMTDDEEISMSWGLDAFGLISTQSEEEIRELVSGLTQSATGKDPEITITTWEESDQQQKINGFWAIISLWCALARVFTPHSCANLMIWQTTWERHHVAGNQSSFERAVRRRRN